ncbi:S-formylglutathione hydrolase [Litorimonas sp. RW-G-Af-16]|uniref:S-formylglutathione hydrolase n=1 Tax=Litorimonas sp. RW-G-Af-16 TaxID=3241168 RepID=UPI00390CB192
MKTISKNKSHGGVQGVYSHASSATKTEMTFSVFVPEGEGPFPVLWFLSGLTCTHANVTEKGEFRAACAEHGIILIAPDTSPRGDDVANDEDYDMGQGAGFYVDATKAPWAEHFQMKTYIEDELPQLIKSEFSQADMSRQGITGHSMGGHGALTIGLRNPQIFRSISAFSPIVSPMNCPWGHKALLGYLGEDRTAWADYDACELIKSGARPEALLIEQGLDDNFLTEQLKPELLEEACAGTGIELIVNRRAGYDHSYYFISTFMADHVAWHAARLK